MHSTSEISLRCETAAAICLPVRFVCGLLCAGLALLANGGEKYATLRLAARAGGGRRQVSFPRIAVLRESFEKAITSRRQTRPTAPMIHHQT